MLRRTVEPLLRTHAARMPAVVVTGPRQSGKSTLCRATFPGLPYVLLEAPDQRAALAQDPRGFVARYRDGAIFDEVQRAPELLSWLQELIDAEPRRTGRFILTGSHQLLMMEKVSQTLAGRVALLTLLPFSLEELAADGRPLPDLWTLVFTGGYPRLHDQGLPPSDWLADYFATYVERDVRDVLKVERLAAFETFIRLCAARSAQLLNLNGLGADAGVSQPTARGWLSALQASYVATTLGAWHANPTKRLVRAPKLHLFDSGLLCWLVGLRSPEQLALHPLRGPIFETWVFTELLKARLHRGLAPDLHHYRDHAGREIDIVLADASAAQAIEVKSTETPFLDPLLAMKRIDPLLAAPWDRKLHRTVIYAGAETLTATDGTLRSWRDLARPDWVTPQAG